MQPQPQPQPSTLNEVIDVECSHLQALETMHMSILKEYLMADQKILTPRLSLPHLQAYISNQLPISKMVCTLLDCVTQGDSRANIALANDRALLTNFTPIIPFHIGIIGQNPIMATHRGIMRLPTVEGLYGGFTTHYSKDSSGSIISPGRHVSESKG